MKRIYGSDKEKYTHLKHVGANVYNNNYYCGCVVIVEGVKLNIFCHLMKLSKTFGLKTLLIYSFTIVTILYDGLYNIIGLG